MLGAKIARMKIRLTRPSADNSRLGRVISTVAPIMKGARASASNANSVTPSRMRNSSVPARTIAIGAPMNATTVKPFRLGVVAPNAITTATSDRETFAAGQPARTKKIAGSAKQAAARISRRSGDVLRSIERRAPRPLRSGAGVQRGESFPNLRVSLQKLPRGKGQRRRQRGRSVRVGVVAPHGGGRWQAFAIPVQRRRDPLAEGRIGRRGKGIQGAGGVHLRCQRNGGTAGCCAAGRAARQLGGETCQLGAKRRDVAQQPGGSRGIGRLIAENGFRIVANAAMEGGQLRRQLWEAVGCGQQVVHHGDGNDADHDRSAALHAGDEDTLRCVDLLDGHECHRVAGEHRGVGSVSIQQSGCVDAESDPCGEGGEEQVSGLGEEAGDRDGCRDADQRCDQPIGGLFQSFSARRLCQDHDRQGGRGGRLQFQPEACCQGDDDGDPNADPEGPGAHRSAGKAQGTRDRRGRHGSRLSRRRQREAGEGQAVGCRSDAHGITASTVAFAVEPFALVLYRGAGTALDSRLDIARRAAS